MYEKSTQAVVQEQVLIGSLIIWTLVHFEGAHPSSIVKQEQHDCCRPTAGSFDDCGENV